MNMILLSQSDFIDSDRAVITGRRLEHLRCVLKVNPNDMLKIGLINGLTGCGQVLSIDQQKCELALVLNRQPPKPLPCTLIMALPRPKTLKKSLEAAVVMGVKRIFIIESFRVEKSYWSSPVLEEKQLHKLSILALEQACDTMLPQIQMRRRFRPFVEDELSLISPGAKLLTAHPGASLNTQADCKEPVVLIIGPEGGFIPFEIDLLEKQGCHTVSFSSRILRVEHAVPAILAKLF
ncbi:MAG: 16S rRNA (uracil(1498)-N(3))-methyltransferase [Chitinispirillales bacterium]|jgi:RsmE family RNA methyltransferase|nr:16S rRNA (uracil(1498)-N(3))-methyltransferase [Chitinispirillales bacterium]